MKDEFDKEEKLDEEETNFLKEKLEKVDKLITSRLKKFDISISSLTVSV